jgi:hypothetical protein
MDENLKQAVYQVFYNMGKTAATKLAEPPLYSSAEPEQYMSQESIPASTQPQEDLTFDEPVYTYEAPKPQEDLTFDEPVYTYEAPKPPQDDLSFDEPVYTYEAPKPTQQSLNLGKEPIMTPSVQQKNPSPTQQFYAQSSPRNSNNSNTGNFYLPNKPVPATNYVDNIGSRISSGNFGPAPSAPTQVPAKPTRTIPRKPRPVAPKPTFDRKGFGDMMSDFGYNSTSPKPIPQNLTNLMPKRTTPINNVVGPAKPLNQILGNKS